MPRPSRTTAPSRASADRPMRPRKPPTRTTASVEARIMRIRAARMAQPMRRKKHRRTVPPGYQAPSTAPPGRWAQWRSAGGHGSSWGHHGGGPPRPHRGGRCGRGGRGGRPRHGGRPGGGPGSGPGASVMWSVRRTGSRRRRRSGRRRGGVRIRLELAADVLHVGVDRALVRLEGHAVDGVEQLRPGEDPAGLAGERREQRELGRRELDAAAGHRRRAAAARRASASPTRMTSRGADCARRRAAGRPGPGRRAPSG